MDETTNPARISIRRTMDEFRAQMEAERKASDAQFARIKAEGLRKMQLACSDPPSPEVVAMAQRLAPEPGKVLPATEAAATAFRQWGSPQTVWQRLRAFLKRATPLALVGLISAGVTGNANDALNFVNTNWAAIRPEALPVSRPGKDQERLRIRTAAIEAAKRHGIPEATKLRLVQRESGFRFVRGPMTPYGHAYGPFQMLCSTARSLGEGDCSRLMRDEHRAAELAALYLKQGYAATGSWQGAAAYYHGGPDKRLWGPKTRAYAAAVAPARDAPFDTRRQFGAAPVLVASFQPTEYR